MPHLGGFGGGWGSGSGGSGFLGGAPGGETVVNNYYDTPPDASIRDDSDRAALNDADNLTGSDDRSADDSASYQDRLRKLRGTSTIRNRATTPMKTPATMMTAAVQAATI